MVFKISKSISQKQVVDPVIGGRYREVMFEGQGRAVYEPKGEGILQERYPLECKTMRPAW